MDTPTRRLARWFLPTRRPRTAPTTGTGLVAPSTRARRTTVLLIILAAISAAATPLEARADDAWSETRTERYLVGDVGPLRDPVGQALTAPSCTLGSVCFGSTVGDTFTVEVSDDSGRRVGGVVIIAGSGGTDLYRPFCGTTGHLPVVRGRLSVHLDAPGDVRGAHWYGGPGCTEIRPLGTTAGATTQGATSGRVQVTFTKQNR